uniref:Rho-GAP domain-containing protein n=1 Tax=Strigamia maritima TaxID=126957 RepID=T1JD08_STRMM
MRRPEGCTSVKSGEMSTSLNKQNNHGIGVDSHVNQMMKILGSPLGSRFKPGNTKKTFGVPLAELIHRQRNETNVPLVVRRLCQFIVHNGLSHEGIFRLNGNVKVIENLKMSFDKCGDANLEEMGDVVATASLLKLFLRELPEALIPKYLHSQFVHAQEENNHDSDDGICHLKQLLEQLPQVNYSTLKYLMAFLTQVAQHGRENKMNSISLGIVFGPNLFRVSEDLEGLRQQSLTNQLVTRFINKFSVLFESDPEMITEKANISKSSSSQSTISTKDVDFTLSYDIIDQVSVSSADSESDISSSDSSPTVAVVATEFVDMAISKSINNRSPKQLPTGESKMKPLTLLSDKKHKSCNGKLVDSGTKSALGPTVPLVTDVCPATPDTKRKEWCCSFDDEYHENKRSVERSQQFQRVSKTRKLRRNVRKSHSLGSLDNGIDLPEDSLKENDTCTSVPTKHNGRMTRAHGSHSFDLDAITSDRPSHPFLELHPQPQAREALTDSSPSPSTVPKSFVPPLDLSILHEHGDGSEPIPINRMRVSWPMTTVEREEADVMVSPRATEMKMKINANLDPDVPPSPPVEQDAFCHMSIKEDEAATASIKHLNKRIYHLKRKIKQFEESFEEEYGYKPSHADKMARSDIKKNLSELNKARKDLKLFKEESLEFKEEMQARKTSQDDETCKKLSDDDKQAIEDSLQEMLNDLASKRRLAQRPDDIKIMSQQQVVEEKVAIQRMLLKFESSFGRPSSKSEMDIMRPMYDRYRNVKRLITKIGSPKAKESGTELEPIIEHQAMDFIQASPQHKSRLDEDMATAETMTNESPDFKKAKKSLALSSSNLHELNTFELLEQHRKVKEEKKRLRRILHEFEMEFQRQTGAQVKREDRTPLESVYGEYKQVKAKLRLLEALLSKHKTRYTV